MASRANRNRRGGYIPLKRSSLGARLRAARLAARLTVSDAAELAGVSPWKISELEANRTKRFSLSEYLRLCAVYGVKPGDIFDTY